MTAMDETLVNLMSGGLIAGYLVGGLFFFKFWRASGDSLFFFFATSLGILALQRLLLSLSVAGIEDQTLFYVLRLAAYVLLLAGIVNKNRRATRRRPPP